MCALHIANSHKGKLALLIIVQNKCIKRNWRFKRIWAVNIILFYWEDSIYNNQKFYFIKC